jgi:hypothetical protein
VTKVEDESAVECLDDTESTPEIERFIARLTTTIEEIKAAIISHKEDPAVNWWNAVFYKRLNLAGLAREIASGMSATVKTALGLKRRVHLADILELPTLRGTLQ